MTSRKSVRAATPALPEQAWAASFPRTGKPRENGQLAEALPGLASRVGPAGARVIVRCERPSARRAAELHRAPRSRVHRRPHPQRQGTGLAHVSFREFAGWRDERAGTLVGE